MLLITCPVCGAVGDESEFHCGGEAHVQRPASSNPADVSDEAQYEYLYVRNNPRGPHREMWQCARGCGKWFNAMRDTLSLQFLAFYKIGDPIPPFPRKKTAAKTRTPIQGRRK